MNYAGLPKNQYHALAKKICPKGAGAVFTFGLKGGYEAGVKLVSNVKLFSHLANIGDVRSLIIHPASTTHRQLTDEQRKAAGAGPDVVRLDRPRGRRRHHRRPGAGLGGRAEAALSLQQMAAIVHAGDAAERGAQLVRLRAAAEDRRRAPLAAAGIRRCRERRWKPWGQTLQLRRWPGEVGAVGSDPLQRPR